VAPAIAERESQIAALEARLRRPRQVPPDLVRLKAALEQRAKDWKRDLRAEPQVARMVVRRLVSPIVLHDESARPEWVRWESAPTMGLLDGLAPAPTRLVASPPGTTPFHLTGSAIIAV
jgi:hypothetical protein